MSGSALKVIAVTSMLIDHIAAYLLVDVNTCQQVWFTVFGEGITLYFLLRMIGRLAFPLCCFLMVEGYHHTHNKNRYGFQLLMFALLSEIPFDLVNNKEWDMSSQNVFFTLWLGYCGMRLYSSFREDRLNQMSSMIIMSVLAFICQADYGLPGFLFIMLMYAWKTYPCIKVGIGCWLLNSSIMVWMSSWLMTIYDGTRGFIRTKTAKFAFYAFYPVHLLLIHLIKICHEYF